MEAVTTSPLDATDPNALQALFEADPTTVSDKKLERVMIPELRRRRDIFAADEAAKSLAPKRTRATPAPTPAPLAAALDKPVGELDLDDL